MEVDEFVGVEIEHWFKKDKVFSTRSRAPTARSNNCNEIMLINTQPQINNTRIAQQIRAPMMS